MSELKATYVRYVGYRATVSRNSLRGNPYHFRKGKWTEIGANEVDFYMNKAKVDDSWEIKTTDKKIMKVHYYAMWKSNNAKQRVTMSLTDKDNNGISIANTLREYIFNNRIWVKINEQDVNRFKTKAAGNVSWEFEKAYLLDGIEAPFTVSLLTIKEHFEKLAKKITQKISINKKPIKQKILATVGKVETIEDPIKPSNIEEKPEEPKPTTKKMVKKSSKKKTKTENDE